MVNGQEIGVAVDAVINIVDENISDPQKKNDASNDSFITGITKLERRIVLIMDVTKILSEI